MTHAELIRAHLGNFGKERSAQNDSIYTADLVTEFPYAPQDHTRRLDGHGQLSDESVQRPNDRGMPVAECARQIVRAIEKRRRELVMTAAGKAGQWMKLIAPGLIDRFVADAVRRFYREQ